MHYFTRKEVFMKLISATLSKRTIIAASIGLLSLPAFALDTSRFDIVNGIVVDPTDQIATHVVAIKTDLYVKIFGAKITLGFQTCTGTIISPHIILTAAHCALGSGFMTAGDSTLFFGVNMDQAVAKLPVSSVIVNPEYVAGAEKNSHDVSIMHFNGDLPSGYSPVSILVDDAVLHSGDEVVSAGYGITSATAQDSGILRKTTFIVHESDYSNDEVSLTENNSAVCHGDSGGPTFSTINGGLFVWGVTSRLDIRADAQAQCKDGAIMTDVRKEESFVRSAMQTLGN